MQPRSIIAVLVGCLLALPASADDGQPTPYADQQARSIKALSDEDIGALRKGEGMGMAKAAELNGYPGPAHVLALGDQLGLTEAQHQQVASAYDRMGAAARPIGDELIARERNLDQLFATRDITPARLATETAAIGELQGRLRSVHLAAHLETRALLNAGQIALYQQLRGYEGQPGSGHPHRHG
jgi:hypothetical protein